MGEATERTDELESADAETLVGRGFDWLSAGEPDRAIEEFDASLLLDPEHGKAFFGRGKRGGPRASSPGPCGILNEAVRLKPDDSEVLGYRAYARHRLGDFMGAVADFDRAIDIAPQCGLALQWPRDFPPRR